MTLVGQLALNVSEYHLHHRTHDGVVVEQLDQEAGRTETAGKRGFNYVLTRCLLLQRFVWRHRRRGEETPTALLWPRPEGGGLLRPTAKFRQLVQW